MLGSVHHEAAAGRITGWDASPRAHDLVDLTVAFPREGLVPHPVREVWELWRHARPAEPGTWRRFTGAPRAIGELLAGTTLVRRRAEVARRCLGVLPYAEGRPPTFGELADGLTAAGVRLVLG
ncbi:MULTISPECIES: hypothetical protein [Streptomyces]|uniref:Uncharacterized protein n=1 Tax=Streptomyces viridochromogenes TaxID=1938 RepID=A0A0L8JLN8_STRVR|nr:MULTISPECIES: hypothetical protein [Streptomyces]KOG14552.1 hypothetical protein ADK34_29210 [Streptomyces viridochromogenes]